MKLKNILSLWIVGVMCIGLVGCKSEEKETTKEASVHVFYYDYNDVYVSTVREHLETDFHKKQVAFTAYDATGEQQVQLQQVDRAIEDGASVLVVNIVETGSDDAALAIIEKAKAKQLPVIFFNREVSDAVVAAYENCAFIGTDAAEAGIMQGQMIGDHLLENFEQFDLNHDGQISYTLFKGQEGNEEAIYRTKYAVEEADKKLHAANKKPLLYYDSLNSNKYQVDQDGTWSKAAAKSYLQEALLSYNESNGKMIELVICNNDDMASGAIEALQEVGYNRIGENRNIPVYGVDASNTAIKLIDEGIMAGTIKQDAAGMAKLISFATSNSTKGNTAFQAIDTVGIKDLTIDKKVAKARIPYEMFFGK
ncbi:hypothetical protein A4S06_10115 [Erysipelotrichaceae bacterium MTC7]|nr:hypothetical protein A4S06_10115 [Erysipelotrichaceae bacterium MTC7]